MTTRAVRWRAPGRVNLIGEHTDYNDGWVLPFALPLGVTATVTARDDAVVGVTSASFPDERVEVRLAELRPGGSNGWATYVLGTVWALRDAGHDVGGVDVALAGDLPPGAGLSSSAAVECGVGGAIGELFGLGLDSAALVEVAHAAESRYVGVPVGVLDQSAVVRCVADHALFLDTRSMVGRQVPLPLADAGLVVLVIDTRAPHRLVDGEYARRRRECARSAELLGVRALRDVTDLADALERLPDEVLRKRTRHIVTENERTREVAALLESGGDVRRIGPLLTDSHRSLRDDFEVSCRELDVAVDAALGSGAHGARMTGGGFGGSAIALVDADAADVVTTAVQTAFADAALNAPHVFAVTPAAGAGPG